jgi:hypothetical protein
MVPIPVVCEKCGRKAAARWSAGATYKTQFHRVNTAYPVSMRKEPVQTKRSRQSGRHQRTFDDPRVGGKRRYRVVFPSPRGSAAICGTLPQGNWLCDTSRDSDSEACPFAPTDSGEPAERDQPHPEVYCRRRAYLATGHTRATIIWVLGLRFAVAPAAFAASAVGAAGCGSSAGPSTTTSAAAATTTTSAASPRANPCRARPRRRNVWSTRLAARASRRRRRYTICALAQGVRKDYLAQPDNTILSAGLFRHGGGRIRTFEG